MNVPKFTAEDSLYETDLHREIGSIQHDMNGQVVLPQYYHFPPHPVACWWGKCWMDPVDGQVHCPWICGGLVVRVV
jgi:hypothetical protein